jgi:hypothetical protein
VAARGRSPARRSSITFRALDGRWRPSCSTSPCSASHFLGASVLAQTVGVQHELLSWAPIPATLAHDCIRDRTQEQSFMQDRDPESLHTRLRPWLDAPRVRRSRDCLAASCRSLNADAGVTGDSLGPGIVTDRWGTGSQSSRTWRLFDRPPPRVERSPTQ